MQFNLRSPEILKRDLEKWKQNKTKMWNLEKNKTDFLGS